MVCTSSHGWQGHPSKRRDLQPQTEPQSPHKLKTGSALKNSRKVFLKDMEIDQDGCSRWRQTCRPHRQLGGYDPWTGAVFLSHPKALLLAHPNCRPEGNALYYSLPLFPKARRSGWPWKDSASPVPLRRDPVCLSWQTGQTMHAGQYLVPASMLDECYG